MNPKTTFFVNFFFVLFYPHTLYYIISADAAPLIPTPFLATKYPDVANTEKSVVYFPCES